MAFTVDDFQDLLHVLEQHPEWRAELRRHVLSDDLLALPGVVREIGEALAALTRRVDQLAEALAALTARVDQLGEALSVLTQRVDQLVDVQASTTLQLGALADRVGALDGEALELRFVRRAPSYLSPLARRLRVVEPGPLADLLDDAVQDGRLTDKEREEALLANVVLTGQRREDQADAYVLVEVSSGIGVDDVQRAAARARILAKMGRPAVPVVAGRWINAEATAMARTLGVTPVLDGKATPPSPAVA